MKEKVLLVFLFAFMFSSCAPFKQEVETSHNPIKMTSVSDLSSTPIPRNTAELEPTQDKTGSTNTTETIPTITLSPTVTEISVLYPDGPWLIYRNEVNVAYVLNKDGTGRTKFPFDIDETMFAPYDASSSLPLIAVISIDESVEYSPILLVVSLPNFEVIQRIPLFSCPQNVPGCVIYEQADIFFQPKWSPDGRYLAFIGACHGRSNHAA
jgi:hypothetical protein